MRLNPNSQEYRQVEIMQYWLMALANTPQLTPEMQAVKAEIVQEWELMEERQTKEVWVSDGH